nr:MAG TPA: helix-turn-helix domain protein [Caudoviricetes sp.]
MTTGMPFEAGRWYSAAQVRETLSLSRATVERLGTSGAVRAIKIGSSVRYCGDDLNAQCRVLGPGAVHSISASVRGDAA